MMNRNPETARVRLDTRMHEETRERGKRKVNTPRTDPRKQSTKRYPQRKHGILMGRLYRFEHQPKAKPKIRVKTQLTTAHNHIVNFQTFVDSEAV